MTYIAGETPVHRCDARVKILVLFVYSIAIFFVHTWWGMGAFACAMVLGMVVGRIPVKRVLVLLLPVIFLAAFAIVFAVAPSPGAESLSNGLIVGVRMIVLVAASFVVCFTTAPSALLRAFSWLIGPLRRVHVPVDDVAFTLSLALRFIPVVADELNLVRTAQKARGANLQNMGFNRKLKVWGAAFTAVFVGMFRHADALATAMDARCYGASEKRTSLPDKSE